jgi:hypothetical protein
MSHYARKTVHMHSADIPLRRVHIFINLAYPYNAWYNLLASGDSMKGKGWGK